MTDNFQIPDDLSIPVFLRRSAIKRDLRTPKYRSRIVPDKKRRAARLACRARAYALSGAT